MSRAYTTNQIVKEQVSKRCRYNASVLDVGAALAANCSRASSLLHATLGGARRDRTADPLLAKQMLSQLSYGPGQTWFDFALKLCRILVGLGGFEPPTSPLSGVRSNHLSYRPGVAKRPCSPNYFPVAGHGSMGRATDIRPIDSYSLTLWIR